MVKNQSLGEWHFLCWISFPQWESINCTHTPADFDCLPIPHWTLHFNLSFFLFYFSHLHGLSFERMLDTLSRIDPLKSKRENYQNCIVIFCQPSLQFSNFSSHHVSPPIFDRPPCRSSNFSGHHFNPTFVKSPIKIVWPSTTLYVALWKYAMTIIWLDVILYDNKNIFYLYVSNKIVMRDKKKELFLTTGLHLFSN